MISSGWEAFKAVDVGERQISLLLHGQRSCIMLTNYLAWYWLDVCIRDACIAIMDKHPVECQWLVQLVQDVQESYNLKLTRRQFSSSSYDITIPSPPNHCTTFQFQYERRKELQGSALRTQVLTTVGSILRLWLGYPPPDEGRIRAWLVHVLVNEIGRPVLYLNSIWKTYARAKKRYVDAQHWNISSFKDVEPLKEAVANHPLANKSSPEYEALQEMGRLFDSFLADNLKLDMLSEGGRESDPAADQIPPQLDSLNERKVKVFAKFVMDCLSIFLGQGEVNKRLKNKMDSNQDKLMPFREHGPSRLRIRGSEGPFTAEYARTTAGAYSAAVWRGVTFATPFSLKNRMIFTSYDDFKLACREAGKQETSYFCDRGAYGQTNPKRNIELAEIYWRTLSTGKWTTFVKDRTVPFIECYKFFMDGYLPPDFPQLGPLASYLLAADFTYCSPKVVEPPTLPELASLICSFNKGAVAGLETIGFIIPRTRAAKKPAKANPKEVEMALERVYDLLKKIIPTDHHETINLDLIMTEHTLCKFSRAISWNIIEKL